MRMRNKKHCGERMERCNAVWIKDPAAVRGKWNNEFKNNNPVHIEIGCGKGRFITETALLNPDINYVAIERVESVLVLAMERVYEKNIENVRFLSADANYLNEYFAEEEVERIYLNFSDPWPKKKRAKRRLTHKNFLDIYKQILTPDGNICFKTDNRDLFDFSLESFQENGFELRNVTFDLHSSGFENNVMTEYEEKFSLEGIPICRLEAYQK